MVALYGLQAVTEACSVALDEHVTSSAHVVNLLHRAASPAPVAPLQVPEALKLTLEPAANCDRYNRLLRSNITLVPVDQPSEHTHANPATDRTTQNPAPARHGERTGGAAKFFYEQLHARNLQASATLFDMRPEVLARSLAAIRRNQPEPSVQTSVGNALALPFPDATFDWIETDHFLQFFPPAQLPALIAQWQRVLKPGGVLTTRFFSPDLANRRERLQNANWKFVSRLLSAPSHFHPTDEIVKFFEAEKFAVATERLYPRPAPPVIALTAFKPNAG